MNDDDQDLEDLFIDVIAPTTILILGALVVLLAMLAPAVAKWMETPTVVYLAAELPEPAPIQPMKANLQSDDDQPSRMQAEEDSVTQFALVPMQYSPKDYGLVLNVQIGNANSLVVFDSGSAKLAVATTDCAKKELCSAQDASYDPMTSPTASATMRAATLSFATLTIDADIVRDRVLLPVMSSAVASSARWVTPRVGQATARCMIGDRFPVYAAVSMKGTNSNVFGFMHSNADDSVFGSLVRKLGCKRRWILACDTYGNAWLGIGEPPSGSFLHKYVGNCRYSPMVRSNIHDDAYVVSVDTFRGGKGKSKAKPTYLVVDTGTADSYLLNMPDVGLPKSNQVVSSADCRQLPHFAITLRGGAKMIIRPTRYMERQPGKAGKTTNFHPGNENIANVFRGNEPIMLLGLAHIRGMCLDFDLENRRIGFGNCC